MVVGTGSWPVVAKSTAKAALGSMIRPAWPAVEALSRAGAGLHRTGLKVTWARHWTPAFDSALYSLPPLPGCPHGIYRELLRPTAAIKRHALVCEQGTPLAIISLRKRGAFWEPVTYQCLPFAIAPARDAQVLGRALRALGVEVVVAGGVGDEINVLNSSASWTYDWHKIDLSGDFEAYWRQKKRQYTISRARRHLETCEIRVDGEGDLQWIIGKWREQWADDPGREIVASEDRLNLWRVLVGGRGADQISVHTLMLALEGRRLGGLVFTAWDGVVMAQCGGRDLGLDDGYLAAAFTVALVNWAKANGHASIDMSGGEYKRHWGPPGGQRHGAMFRPPLIQLLRRVQPD